MWAMVVKEFQELRRDRRTMAMLIVLPLLLLVVFGYAANFRVSSIPTDVYGPQAPAVADRLQDPFHTRTVDSSGTREDAETAVRDNKVDVAIVTQPSGAPVALVDGSSLFAAQSAVSAFNRLGGQVGVDVLYNPELKTSWVMVPALAGLILTFIGVIVTSLGLVRERQEGTLEQLAVMPFRPFDVIAGKIAPYFLFAAFDMVLVTVLGVVLFDVPFNGSVAVFAVGAILFLLVLLGLGGLISSVSQNAGQAIQLAMFVMLPSIMFSGMIFPLTAMPWAVRWIGYVLPLTYFINIAQGVMLRGAPFTALWLSFLVLAVYAVVVFSAAVLRLRGDLAPSVKAQPRQEPGEKAAAPA
ncbi:MAG TPA: ABC transporter permease [Gaiellaceae bacterium]|nr:ABC transporter permease [Gaiellaceae bacterium]